MKKPLLILLLLAFVYESGFSQNIAERLGYEENAKLLIIHADDLGLSRGENQATLESMKNGVVNSTSVMVPCPWSPEAGLIHKANPDLDVGVHITLTNEWFLYKWGSVSDEAAAGLENEDGYMFADCASVAKNASPEDVEAEINAQVDLAISLGIKPTHLDSHMGCIFYGRPEYLQAYLRVAKKHGIPAMLNEQMVKGIIEPNAALFEEFDLSNYPLVDQVISALPQNYESGMDAYYSSVLDELGPGLNVILIHVAYDDLEMQGIATDHDYWHAPWRQQDFDFFTSQKAKDLLQENDIKLVTWREIGELL